MITRQDIEGQIQSHERQRELLLIQLHQTEGAIRQCKHWLGLIQRKEDEAAQKRTCAVNDGLAEIDETS